MPRYIKYFILNSLLWALPLSIFSSSTTNWEKVYKDCQQIMTSNPDSAFQILNNILDTGKLTPKDQIFPYLIMQLGDYHRVTGNYDSSYVKYLSALSLFEQRKDTNLIAEAQINIGILFDLQRDPESAIKKYYEGLKNYLIVKDSTGVVKAYMNLGISYKNIGLNNSDDLILDSAFVNYHKAEAYLNKLNQPLGLTKLYINIGNLKYTQKLYVEAIYYYKKSLKIAKENNYNRELSLSLDNLGWAYQELRDYPTALAFAMEGLIVGRKINSKYNIVNSLSNISLIYERMGDYKKAYEINNELILVKDSLISENAIELQKKLESKYESEKKDAEISFLNLEKDKDKAIAEAQKKEKNIIILSITLGLILVVIFSLFLYKRFKITKEQKNVIDQKNRDITDSISYAKRIQTALLKEEEHVNENLPAHFIFYKPKDIVSGDFYWTAQKHDYLYVAAADCTGHGVPGALLTMLGTAFLNEISAQEKILTPAEILEELRIKFIKELGQTGKLGESRDGMDISLIQLNLKTKELTWSGANNPLYLIKNNNPTEVVEIRPNKQPIGYYHHMNPFKNHTLKLETNDVFYLFSDGFPDQFGGPKGKKFMYKPFKKLLLDIHQKSMSEQKDILQSTFSNWMGNFNQIDDVCILGIKI